MSKSQVIFEFDEGILENIKKTFADKSSVEIGVLSGGKTAAVAKVQEFGASPRVSEKMRYWFGGHGVNLSAGKTHIHIPQRSFLRKTAYHKQGDFMKWLEGKSEGLLELIVTGNWGIALQQFAWKWKSYVKECFATRGFGQWFPLASFTVMDKGHDTPLVRTGRLEKSIDAKVVEK